MTSDDYSEMRISDVTCSCCGAGYERAETESVIRRGELPDFKCTVCGSELESQNASNPNLVAYRLVVRPEIPPSRRRMAPSITAL